MSCEHTEAYLESWFEMFEEVAGTDYPELYDCFGSERLEELALDRKTPAEAYKELIESDHYAEWLYFNVK